MFDLYRQVSLRFAPSNQQWVGIVGAADDGPGLQEVQTCESFRDVHSLPPRADAGRLNMPHEMSGPGCGVTVLGRAGLRYREGSQTVFVDGEMLTGAFDFVIYESSIRAWEGTETPIDDAKRREIVANIQATFRQGGLKVDVAS